jgi:hypothetical protein
MAQAPLAFAPMQPYICPYQFKTERARHPDKGSGQQSFARLKYNDDVLSTTGSAAIHEIP